MLHKSFLIITIPALILFFCACNNSSANRTNTPGAKINASSANATTSDANLTGTEGSFSYTIDGKRVETINYKSPATLFISEVSNDAANGMAKIEVTTNSSNVFDFQVVNSGTTSIANYSPSLGSFGDKKNKVATYMDGKTAHNFYGGPVTITITAISATRVSGNFSGKFTDTDYGGATVEITDGSFNLPFEKN